MSAFDHVDDYPEIPVSLASTRTTLKTGAWRSVRPTLAERPAPCTAACPAGVDVPGWLADVTAGRIGEAFAAISRHNPFPAVTGRVCPHFCEQECNLAARTGAGAVSIRAMERWLGDATAHLPHPVGEGTGKRVAVVGAGPAGLSAACFLRRTGHDVTVFDRHDRPGGMLRHAIPEYRLPASVVDAEVARLTAMGIEFRGGVTLGDGLDFDGLRHGYDAVFVATGAGRHRPIGIPGETLLEPGLAFLEAVKRGGAELPGRTCAVVGGGNTAMDVARVLRRMGAEVTVLYRRTEAELPAIREEYDRAVAEGVAFTWLTQPRSVRKDGARLVVTAEAMRLGVPDPSGRPRPEPTGTRRELRFDAVFAAIGETAEVGVLPGELRDPAGRAAVAADGRTSDARVFAGGDLATGPATVVAAIAAGRLAARAIDSELGFGDRWPAEAAAEPVPPGDVNPAYAARHPRAATRPGPAAEETATLTEAEVLAEIERCMSCGHCNACGICFAFCPDGAVAWDGGPVVDLAFCKGCGICVTECPGHVFVLVPEREPSHA